MKLSLLNGLVIGLLSVAQVPLAATVEPAALSEKATADLRTLSNALAQADWAAGEAACRALVTLGPGVVPLLMAELKKDSGSRPYRERLVDILVRVAEGGPESTKALLELSLSEADTANLAGGWLANRAIDVPLADSAVATLVGRMTNATPSVGANWASVLTHAARVDKRLIIDPLIQQFKRAIREAKGMNSKQPGNCFEPEAALLDIYVSLFGSVGTEVAVPPLRREIAANSDSRTVMWLTIAAGMSGDQSVTNALLHVVESDRESSSTRAVAIRGFARCAGQSAIPVLERYTADRTPGPNPDYPPIAAVARDELARLRAAAQTERICVSLSVLSNALARADWAASEAAESELVALGSGVLPSLVREVKEKRGSRVYRSQLVMAVAKIQPLRDSTEALLDITLNDSEMANVAGTWMGYRTLDGFSLTTEQLAALVSRIGDDTDNVATHWGHILARSTNVDQRLIIKPLVDRLKRAVPESKVTRETAGPGRYIEGSLVNTEVTYIHPFLMPFRFIKTDIAAEVLPREIAAAQDAQLRFWLQVAAGMTGEESVGPALLKVVEAETQNSSVRCEALMGYILALREKAVPIAEKYLSDNTPGPNPRYPPIRTVAKSELHKLRKGAGE